MNQIVEIACPFCKETIKAGALKCKHCQSDLTTETGSPPTTLDEIAELGGVISSKMYFHGIATAFLAFVTLMVTTIGNMDPNNPTPELSQMLFFVFGIPTAAYAAWICFKEHSSKKLPKLAFILLSVSMFIAFGSD